MNPRGHERHHKPDAMPTPTIQIKRVYEPASDGDGYRVLVDRLWPRGVHKDELPFDEWRKDLAPSPELRTWFGHDPAKFAEFSKRYRKELDGRQNEMREVIDRAARGVLTLLYAAKDPDHNHALVLRDRLAELPRA